MADYGERKRGWRKVLVVSLVKGKESGEKNKREEGEKWKEVIKQALIHRPRKVMVECMVKNGHL